MRPKPLRTWWWIVPLVAVSFGAAGREVPLVDAVKAADTAAVRVLLARGVDANASEANGTTALHWAARLDRLDSMDLLISAGANVKAANRYGVTPLSLACANGNATIIERLLKAGADPNTALPGGETALMTTARKGSADAVKVLVAHGADINARESTRGQTALMWAAAQNNVAAIQALLAAGADIHARSAEPEFKSNWVVGNGAAPLPTEVRIEFTSLLFAVRAGHVEAVEALLAGGANVNDTAPNGTSALLLATINAHWELAGVLLDKGADPNAAATGWTALHQVARNRAPSIGYVPPPVQTGRLSSLDLVKKLIAHGANSNARMTKDMVDGYPNRLNRIGATPFLLAAKGLDIDLMRLLLANGADPLLTNDDKTTPLMAAAGVGIAYQGGDSGTHEDALKAVKWLLLELGSQLETPNRAGETALHGAARRGANVLVQFLVDRGARLDARTKRGLIPIDFADGRKVESTLRAQPQTVALLRQLMKDRGLPTGAEPINGNKPSEK